MAVMVLCGAPSASCAGPSAECASDATAARIAALGAGETLELASTCVVSGALTVPAGATVRGGTFMLGRADSVTLTASADGTPLTTLEGARITGGSERSSVRVLGSGSARIADTTFEIERGTAIGVDGARVEVQDVDIVGNIDPARVLDVPDPAPPDRFATYGVAVIHGGSVTITGGRIARLASAAIVCTDATLALTDVVLDENRGAGLLAFTCEVRATRVEVTRTLALPGVGIALFDGSTLATGESLHLHDASGYGLFASASTISLTHPVVERMAQAGVWAENGASLTITDGMFDDNAGAAVAAVGASLLDVRTTMVVGTRSALLPTSEGAGADRFADAIHVAQLSSQACVVSIADVVLIDNERVGLVLDGGGDAVALTVARTRIEGTESALGAVAQNVDELPPTWDADVMRIGSPLSLDPAAGVLIVSDGSGAVGVLMPPTITF
jgi:hypothetical protein